MQSNLIDLYFGLQIRGLVLLAPTTLFQKLGQLDWYSDMQRQWIDSHIHDKHLKILDVGCATGCLSDYLHRSGHQVSGVDKSSAMIKVARKQNPQIDFQNANAMELPFGDQSFDIVASASLINVVPEPYLLIKEMVRVCRQGGWITFQFPMRGFSDMDLNRCISSLHLSGFSKSAITTWRRFAPKVSIEELNHLLEQNGLPSCEPTLYLNGMVASISIEKHF